MAPPMEHDGIEVVGGYGCSPVTMTTTHSYNTGGRFGEPRPRPQCYPDHPPHSMETTPSSYYEEEARFGGKSKASFSNFLMAPAQEERVYSQAQEENIYSQTQGQMSYNYQKSNYVDPNSSPLEYRNADTTISDYGIRKSDVPSPENYSRIHDSRTLITRNPDKMILDSRIPDPRIPNSRMPNSSIKASTKDGHCPPGFVYNNNHMYSPNPTNGNIPRIVFKDIHNQQEVPEKRQEFGNENPNGSNYLVAENPGSGYLSDHTERQRRERGMNNVYAEYSYENSYPKDATSTLHNVPFHTPKKGRWRNYQKDMEEKENIYQQILEEEQQDEMNEYVEDGDIEKEVEERESVNGEEIAEMEERTEDEERDEEADELLEMPPRPHSSSGQEQLVRLATPERLQTTVNARPRSHSEMKLKTYLQERAKGYLTDVLYSYVNVPRSPDPYRRSPEVSSAEPEVASAEPEVSSVGPEVSSEEPEIASAEPEKTLTDMSLTDIPLAEPEDAGVAGPVPQEGLGVRLPQHPGISEDALNGELHHFLFSLYTFFMRYYIQAFV